MEEKNTPNAAWDELIDELGVEADSQALERHQPESTELSSASVSQGSDAPPDPPQSQPSDWNALASSLGVEVPQEAAASTSQPEPSEPDEVCESVDESDAQNDVEELPSLPSEIDRAMDESDWDDDSEEISQDEDSSDSESGISGEAARSAFDALFSEATSEWEISTNDARSLDTPLEIQLSEDDAADQGIFDSDVVEEEEKEERPKRRRSRRRGRRGRGRKTSESETTESESQEEADSTASETSESAEQQDRGDGSTESEEEKPRRRRPRRRRSRKSAEDQGPHMDDSEGDREDAESVLVHQNGADSDESDISEPRSRGRSRHRNLPTWSEAIGGIVDSNLQQRKNSPNKSGASRGRGRGRGRKKN